MKMRSRIKCLSPKTELGFERGMSECQMIVLDARLAKLFRVNDTLCYYFLNHLLRLHVVIAQLMTPNGNKQTAQLARAFNSVSSRETDTLPVALNVMQHSKRHTNLVANNHTSGLDVSTERVGEQARFH